MTNREFYNAIIEATEITEEIKEYAIAAVEKMDATNEARAKANAEKKAEKEAIKAPIRNAIFACVSNEAKTATTLIEEAGVEIKPTSIPSLLKPLVEAGEIVKVDMKVEKKTVRGYVLPTAE